jgi:hypothetical protein
MDFVGKILTRISYGTYKSKLSQSGFKLSFIKVKFDDLNN